MIRTRFVVVALACVMLGQIGCGGESRLWELAVENRGETSCMVAIGYGEDGSRSARVEQLSKGPPQVIVAEPVETPLRTVTVKVGENEQSLKPDTKLTRGKRYTVIITADGDVSVVTADK